MAPSILKLACKSHIQEEVWQSLKTEHENHIEDIGLEGQGQLYELDTTGQF
jgi:hypothetical protein